MLSAVTNTSGFYYGFLGLEVSTATAESGWGLGFVYIICFCLLVKVALIFSHYTLFI
jgi:hypothetical protein